MFIWNVANAGSSFLFRGLGYNAVESSKRTEFIAGNRVGPGHGPASIKTTVHLTHMLQQVPLHKHSSFTSEGSYCRPNELSGGAVVRLRSCYSNCSASCALLTYCQSAWHGQSFALWVLRLHSIWNFTYCVY